MKRKMKSVALAGILAMLAAGCSTVIVRDYPSCRSEGFTSVYPATAFDGFCIITGGGNLEGKVSPAGYLLLSPFWLLDLPVSLVTDTVFLPSDLYRTIKKEPKKDRSEPQGGGYSPPAARSVQPTP